MTKTEIAILFVVALFVGLIIGASVQSNARATKACRETLALARTRSDSIATLNAKYGGVSRTCAERLLP